MSYTIKADILINGDHIIEYIESFINDCGYDAVTLDAVSIMVEGIGSEEKAEILIDELISEVDDFEYVPFEVSEEK